EGDPPARIDDVANTGDAGAEAKIRTWVIYWHDPAVTGDGNILVGRPNEVRAGHVRPEDVEVGQPPHRGLPVGFEAEDHLRPRLQRVRRHAGRVLIGQTPVQQVESIGTGRRPIWRQDQADPAVPAVPRLHQLTISGDDLVYRPGIAHRRRAHLCGQVG